MKSEWFKLDVGTRTKQDHGGFSFTLELLSCFYFNFQFYDSRHWNYEEDRWYEPGEELENMSITEEHLLEAGYERGHGQPLFSKQGPINTVDFYNKSIKVGNSMVMLHVYKDTDTGEWSMTDNWTTLRGDVHDIYDLDNWERFLNNKRLY